MGKIIMEGDACFGRKSKISAESAISAFPQNRSGQYLAFLSFKLFSFKAIFSLHLKSLVGICNVS